MRVLLDECVPKRLRRGLPGHDVKTVTEMGWSGKKNGELLTALTGGGFEVLITVDQNLRYQQNLPSFAIAVIVLMGASNRLSDLLPLMPSTLTALSSIKPRDVIEIDA